MIDLELFLVSLIGVEHRLCDFFLSFIMQNCVVKLNMEQSFQNENIINYEDGCEIIMDDVMEEERTKEPYGNHEIYKYSRQV
jgi:hypothetical protein